MNDIYKELLVVGAGGHARVVLSTLRACNLTAIGCIALEPLDSKWPGDVPWLGDDSALKGLNRHQIILVNGIGSTVDTARRRKIFENAKAEGFRFAILRHPSAFIDPDVVLEEGAQIMAGVILQTGVRIGANVIVNTGVQVDHDSQIGDHVHLAPAASLSGDVTVEVGAHVGSGAVIIQGVTVGAGATIGAGSVLLTDVAPETKVGGVPARPLR